MKQHPPLRAVSAQTRTLSPVVVENRPSQPAASRTLHRGAAPGGAVLHLILTLAIMMCVAMLVSCTVAKNQLAVAFAAAGDPAMESKDKADVMKAALVSLAQDSAARKFDIPFIQWGGKLKFGDIVLDKAGRPVLVADAKGNFVPLRNGWSLDNEASFKDLNQSVVTVTGIYGAAKAAIAASHSKDVAETELTKRAASDNAARVRINSDQLKHDSFIQELKAGETTAP